MFKNICNNNNYKNTDSTNLITNNIKQNEDATLCNDGLPTVMMTTLEHVLVNNNNFVSSQNRIDDNNIDNNQQQISLTSLICNNKQSSYKQPSQSELMKNFGVDCSMLKISQDGKQRVNQILDDINKLSPIEKVALYYQLPSGSPDYDPLKFAQNPLGSRSEINYTINWIKSHLERDPNVSIPKQEVYEDYELYCKKIQIKPLSTADFGKVMKQIFPGIHPRRLGTRGNSRYCYAAMRKTINLAPPTLPDIRSRKSSELIDVTAPAPPAQSLQSSPLPTPVPSTAETSTSCTSSASIGIGNLEMTPETWATIKLWSEKLLNITLNNINELADLIKQRNCLSSSILTLQRKQSVVKQLTRKKYVSTKPTCNINNSKSTSRKRRTKKLMDVVGNNINVGLTAASTTDDHPIDNVQEEEIKIKDFFENMYQIMKQEENDVTIDILDNNNTNDNNNNYNNRNKTVDCDINIEFNSKLMKNSKISPKLRGTSATTTATTNTKPVTSTTTTITTTTSTSTTNTTTTTSTTNYCRTKINEFIDKNNIKFSVNSINNIVNNNFINNFNENSTKKYGNKRKSTKKISTNCNLAPKSPARLTQTQFDVDLTKKENFVAELFIPVPSIKSESIEQSPQSLVPSTSQPILANTNNNNNSNNNNNDNKLEDCINTDILIPRERVISVCSIDKHELDDYLVNAEQNSSDESPDTELLQYFQEDVGGGDRVGGNDTSDSVKKDVTLKTEYDQRSQRMTETYTKLRKLRECLIGFSNKNRMLMNKHIPKAVEEAMVNVMSTSVRKQQRTTLSHPNRNVSLKLTTSNTMTFIPISSSSATQKFTTTPLRTTSASLNPSPVSFIRSNETYQQQKFCQNNFSDPFKTEISASAPTSPSIYQNYVTSMNDLDTTDDNLFHSTGNTAVSNRIYHYDNCNNNNFAINHHQDQYLDPQLEPQQLYQQQQQHRSQSVPLDENLSIGKTLFYPTSNTTCNSVKHTPIPFEFTDFDDSHSPVLGTTANTTTAIYNPFVISQIDNFYNLTNNQQIVQQQQYELDRLTNIINQTSRSVPVTPLPTIFELKKSNRFTFSVPTTPVEGFSPSHQFDDSNFPAFDINYEQQQQQQQQQQHQQELRQLNVQQQNNFPDQFNNFL